MGTTPTTTKTMTCGFCDTDAHHRCPWGVRNGDGGMVICVCRECHEPENRRCTDCGNRTTEEVGDSWRCLDLDACKAEQQARMDSNPFVQQMARVKAAREALEALPGVKTAPKATNGSEAPSRAARPTSRACLCDCGGTTKGGNFLPGHDSKYLNSLVEKRGPLARECAYEISEAFGKKYDKRTSK